MGYYYDFSELVSICNTISGKLDTVITLLQNNLTPILYIITFALLLKIGFTCLRGYKV